MKIYSIIALALVLALATCAFGLEKRAYQIKEDYGTEPLYTTALQYYYYIPCPTYSWFWGYFGFTQAGYIIGEFFEIGDMSMGGWDTADPYNCHQVEQIRVLDFAGYGTVYPTLFTQDFGIICADYDGCPVGAPLWRSGALETHFGWNYIAVNPPDGISICPCNEDPGPPPGYPRILVFAQHVGSNTTYPQWGMDNISSHLAGGCVMHDLGCLPVVWPRPFSSYYRTIHTGYYGPGFVYCPPQWFLDGNDSTGYVYGFIELAWRVYLICSGPTPTEPSTWGSIKAMYR
jgi:hypothetical protein